MAADRGRVVWIFLMAVAPVLGGTLPQDYCHRNRPGNYEHPSDCSSFVICAHGRTIIQSCGGGMHYNHKKQQCDYAYNVPCHITSALPTPHVYGATEDDYKYSRNSDKYPRNSDKYSGRQPNQYPPSTYSDDEERYGKSRAEYIDNKPNHYVHAPQSEAFNNFNKISGYKATRYESSSPVSSHSYPQSYPQHYPQSYPQSYLANYPGQAPDDKVNGKEIDCIRDGMFRDSTDCSMYYQCTGGRKYQQICPFGTAFNPKTEACGFDTTVCDRESPTVIVPSSSSSRSSGSKKSAEDSEKMTFTVNLVPDAPTPIPDKDPERLGISLMERMNKFFATEASMAARRSLRSMLKIQADIARKIKVTRSPFSRVSAFLGATSYTKQLAMPAFEQLECIRILSERFSLDRDQLKNAMNEIPTSMKPSGVKTGPDQDFIQPKEGFCPFPENSENNNCDRYSKYRTFDGSCNNLKYPLWGKSFRNLHRALSPDYADGIGEPRQSRSGNFLPSARSVSLGVHQGHSSLSTAFTVMHQTFGQFLDHDMDRTAITKLSKDEEGKEMVDVECGESECETDGMENEACLPIYIPKYDPDYRNKTCIKFVRSSLSMLDDCSLGPREQLNQITSYLDASQVYGNTKNDSEKLMDKSLPGRAPLKLTPHPFNRRFKGLLPQKANVNGCMDNNDTVECFTAGDGRVNEQVGLSAIHHVWHRAHNSIENILYSINPHWNAQTLYQETRRLIGAAWQHIVFNEYIPSVVGQANVKKYGLQLAKYGYWNGYDESINADVSNVFATAAFRFGHSQIGDMIRFSSQIFRHFQEINFSKVFDRPYRIYSLTAPDGASGVDSIILGMLSQRTEDADRFFSKEVTAQLFSDEPTKLPGMDLVSINIQRGRDHGLPGYMEWREWCGLPRAKSFEDMHDLADPEVRRILATLYETVDDIDLYAGGMIESHVPGGLVGPTFACIIGRQFHRTRAGDRFWYEREDPVTGFTNRQLTEIRKFTHAFLICQNLDYVHTIQKFVNLQPYSEAIKTVGRNNPHLLYDLASQYRGHKNERQPCKALLQPNFNEWRENPTHRWHQK